MQYQYYNINLSKFQYFLFQISKKFFVPITSIICIKPKGRDPLFYNLNHWTNKEIFSRRKIPNQLFGYDQLLVFVLMITVFLAWVMLLSVSNIFLRFVSHISCQIVSRFLGPL